MDRQSVEEKLKRQGGVIENFCPFTKLMLLVCTVVLSILFGSLIYIAFISAVYIILSLAAHVSRDFLKSYFRLFIFFGLMLILMSSFFQSNESEVLFSMGKVSIYEEGFYRGCRMSSIILSVAGGLLFFTETTPIQDLMAMLGNLGLSSDIVYVVVATFQSITELSGRMEQILDAQRSRGIETDGNLIVRAKAVLPMLITLLLSSMVSAEEKAIALEARCFNCQGTRTALRVYKATAADIIAMIVLALITGGIAVAGFML